MTIHAAIIDAVKLLGHSTPPSLAPARAGLLAVDHELCAMGLRLAVVGADADPLQIPHGMLVRLALSRAAQRGIEHGPARLARMLAMSPSTITRYSSGASENFSGADAAARIALLQEHLRDPDGVPMPTSDGPPRKLRAVTSKPPRTIAVAISSAAAILGQPTPPSLRGQEYALSTLEWAIMAMGVRLAVVGHDTPVSQIPHRLLIRAAIARAVRRGEERAQARLARFLGIDDAVISGIASGARASFGGSDGRARLEMLMEHLHNPIAHPLPPPATMGRRRKSS